MRSFAPSYKVGAVWAFALLHLAAIGVFFVPFRWSLVGWFLAAYFVRMFGVTAGYHRYFSHRSYKLPRVTQFLMAFLAQTSAQKGVLWWAQHHRLHHRYSDKDDDVHSPLVRGFWWAHVGWVISNEFDDYDPKLVADFTRFPELVWISKWHWIPAAVFGASLFLIGGLPVFVWGFVLSTVALYHGTFSINSLAHLFGSRRFETPDASRNNFWLALVTMGEGWHNNHHFSLSSCRQGFRWWELDCTFYILKVLSWVRIARDLRPFRNPARAVAAKLGLEKTSA